MPLIVAQEDKEQFCNAVRSEVKSAGLMDTPENLWDFFIEKVRWLSSSRSHPVCRDAVRTAGW